MKIKSFDVFNQRSMRSNFRAFLAQQGGKRKTQQDPLIEPAESRRLQLLGHVVRVYEFLRVSRSTGYQPVEGDDVDGHEET